MSEGHFRVCLIRLALAIKVIAAPHQAIPTKKESPHWSGACKRRFCGFD
jgi:hypothetical protein